jgi:hypothetical protein
VVESLPTKSKALTSDPSTAKKKKKRWAPSGLRIVEVGFLFFYVFISLLSGTATKGVVRGGGGVTGYDWHFSTAAPPLLSLELWMEIWRGGGEPICLNEFVF